MTAVSGGSNPIKPLHRFLLVLVILLSGIGASAVVLSRHVTADDDNLWLAASTWKLFAPVEVAKLETTAAEELRKRNFAPESILRFEQRRDYDKNYAGAIAVWRAASAFVPAVSPRGEAFQLAVRMTAMFFAGCVLVWLILSVIFARIRDIGLLTGLALGVAVTALLSVSISGQGSFALGLDRSLAQVIPNFLRYLVKPPDALLIYGFTGRSLCAVLFLGVFALRWAGMPVASAALYLLCFLMHASLALLLLPFLLACIVLGKERINPVQMGLIGIGTIYALFTESLWRTTISPKLLIAAVLAAAVLFALLLAQKFSGRIPAIGKLTGRLFEATGIERLLGNDPIRRDLVIVAAAWLLTFPATIIIGKLADPISAKYFWFQIHARTLSVFHPIFLCGIATLLVRRHSLGLMASLLLAVMTVSIVGAAIKANERNENAVARLTPQFAAMERFIASGGREFGGTVRAPDADDPKTHFRYENVVYFAIERTMATKQDRLTPALSAVFNASK